ncbi:hypothetical protein CANINC_004683 [Pichia inconspicua]|uniref:Uncharacterized protein n=1 Tax=Pichia inconspicua TaxID=52247 RepID=A0A4T0WVY5_9ASCO|nr:hypothetical protein CANINC_004683 [[Candida] inconspicua]
MRSEVTIKNLEPSVCIELPSDIATTIRGDSQFFTPKVVVLKETELETQKAKFFNTTHEFGLFCIRIHSNSISVIPIQLNGYANPKLQSFNFKLPAGIINNCFCVSEVADTLVIGFILDVNILVTLKLPFNSFYNGLNENFNTWCKYHMPFPFDRRTPLYLHSLDYNKLLFSTVDAGLFLLHRYNPLSDFKLSTIANGSYLNSLKSKLFGTSSTIKFNDLSVAPNSIIDIVSISELIFVTLDVNKILKFWNVTKLNLVKEYNLNNTLDDSLHGAVVSPFFPTKIMKFINDKLYIFLSFDNYYINIFNLDNELNLDLVDRVIYENSTFVPVDYFINKSEIHIVSLSSDTYLIQTYMNGRWEKPINNTKFTEIKYKEFLQKVEHTDSSYAVKFIRNNFSADIINNATQLVHPNVEIEEVNNTPSDWIRFASICADLSTSESKIFAIVECDGFLILAKSCTFSVVKNLNKFELFYFEKENEAGKLTNLLLDYSKGYDGSRYEIENIFLSAGNKIMDDLFNNYISKISNESVVSQLLDQLSSIPSVTELMESLAFFTSDFTSSIASEYTSFNESFLHECLINNSVLGKKIIFGLLLVLDTIDYSEEVANLFTKLRKIYKTLNLIELVSQESTIAFIKLHLPKLYFKNNQISDIVNKVFDLLNSDCYAYFVVCETQDPSLFNYLNDSVTSILVKSLVLLETGRAAESKDLFIANPQICNIDLLSSKVFQRFERELSLLLTKDESQYFYNVAMLFDERKYYNQALEIAMRSMHSIETLNKIFQLALKVNNYRIAYDTIKEMDHEFRSSPLKSFIYKLLNENQYSLLIELDYNEDYDMVDELIVELASNCEDVAMSKKFYRLVYALRLKEGDFRGAVQALYAFGSRAKDYGNFLVMINLLKTLSPDDRWFVQDGRVITEEMLQEEYADIGSTDLKKLELVM